MLERKDADLGRGVVLGDGHSVVAFLVRSVVAFLVLSISR
jgi:hypothetical protein